MLIWVKVLSLHKSYINLMLGNSLKPCHPRNVGLPKFMKQVRESSFMKKGCISEEGTRWRVQMSFRCFASSWTGMELTAEQGSCIRTFDLFQDVRSCENLKPGNHGSMESGNRGNQGIEDRRSLGIMDLRTYALRSPKFGGHGWRIRESIGSQVKDVT
jgi:hypothetical protein